MSKAMLRLREVKHPISETTIGFRIEAAVPNKAAKAFGKPSPSFRKPYFLGQTSDVSESQLEAKFESMLEKIRKDLKWQGYNETFFVK